MTRANDLLIPTTLPGRFLAHLRRRGGDADGLLHAFRLPPSTEQQPLLVLPRSTIVAFCEAAAEAAKDPFLGVHVAESGLSDVLQVLAFACSGAATLGEALERYVQFVSTAHEVLVISLHRSKDGVTLRQSIPGVADCLGRHGNEHWLTTMLLGARRLAPGDWAPSRVWLAHRPPPRLDDLVRALGTPHLTFQAGRNAIEVGARVLATPVHAILPGVSSVLDRWAARTPPPRTDVSDVLLQVRAAIEDRLPGGPPLIQDIARAIRTSARTLQRRLTEEGHTFQGVLDDVRRDMAVRHVEGSETPLAAIAEMVGYSKQSAFFRSFRRWTGTTPAQARQAAKKAPPGRRRRTDSP